MKLVLLVIHEPKTGDRKAADPWETLWKDQLIPDMTTKGVERLAKNVFLIQLDVALPAFCGLVGRAAHWGVPYGAHFFEDDSEWFGTWKPIPSPESASRPSASSS